MLCIGHRGAAGHAPENTLRSFEKALSLGAPWVELDVHLVEGQLIVIHDDDLARTTNGTGKISAQSFDYIRTLDAGAGERVPTLAEVFDQINRRAKINVELKGKGTAAPTVALVNTYVQHHGWSYDDFLISSFEHEMLRTVAHQQPALKIGALFEPSATDILPKTEALQAYSANVALASVTPSLITQAHERGLQVYVYTANDALDIQRLHAWGVDGVFSDFPDRVLAIIP